MRCSIAILATAFTVLLAACSTSTETSADESESTEDRPSLRVNPLNPDESASPETPTAERIASLLQEAKMQYDDGHYQMSLQFAGKVEELIRRNRFPDSDLAMAINIQGYSLLQAGNLERYWVKTHGPMDGALEKFGKVLAFKPSDLRASLGIGLARFRLHADKVRKAEVVGQGVQSLELLEQELRAASQAADAGATQLLRQSRRRLSEFTRNREKLLKVHYIFKDLSRSPVVDEERERRAPWLAGMDEGAETLKLKDVEFTIDDAVSAGAIDREIAAVAARDLRAVAENWRKVHRYWRIEALKDLQDSRDRLLKVREQSPSYFWIERDLVFVYQSLGAYFLDVGLEQARAQATAAGVPQDRLEVETRAIYLSREFDSPAKRDSKKNYRVALDLTKTFVRLHQRFEQQRVDRRDSIEFADETSNPFQVDLVVRFRATMDELIMEDRTLRLTMILEAAALCIEPLFQINSLPDAELWAKELQVTKPNDPIHHFVRATAYFQVERYQDAIDSYRWFLKDSSVAQDFNRRNLALRRIRHCEEALRRAGGAGED